MLFSLSALIGYLIGSIPFGLVLTKLAKTEDIRNIGSKSIGATNVLRTGRKDLAVLTVLLDASKAGLIAFLVARYFPTSYMDSGLVILGNYTAANLFAGLLAGTSAIVGHSFPVWLKFKGGKSVASSFGLFVAMTPFIGLLSLLTWLATAIITRYSSLSAIVAFILTPVYTFYFATPIYNVFYIPIVVLVLIRHHSNIKRLLTKTESKISFKKKK